MMFDYRLTPIQLFRFNICILLMLHSMQSNAVDSLEFSATITSSNNSPEAVVDLTLDTICPDIISNSESNIGNLQLVCGFINNANKAEVTAITRELSAKPNTSTNTLASKTPSVSSPRGIGARLFALRKSAKQTLLKSFRKKRNSYGFEDHRLIFQNTSDESTGLLSQRLSGFINVNYVTSEQFESSTEIGSESLSKGLLFGLDYRIKSSTFVGIATQYFKTSADLSDSGSQLDANQFSFTLYGTHFINQQLYIEATLNNSQQQMKLIRQIDLVLGENKINAIATGETNSQQFEMYFGTGYEIPLKMGFNSLVSAGLSYSTITIDSYSEKNAGNLGLSVDSQNIENLSTTLNGYLSKTFSTKMGVVIPQISATWIHTTDKKQQEISSNFVDNSNNTKFVFNTPKPDPNYFIVSLDMQLILPHGRFAFVKYSNIRRLRDKAESAISTGFRAEF